MGGVEAASRQAAQVVEHVAIDGEISGRDEASIRETLQAFSPDVVDAVIARAKGRAEGIRGKFDTIAASGTLGALSEPNPANIRKVMRNYTGHKAEALVANNKNWGGLNLKEDALGKELADFVRADPVNADRVIKNMMVIGGDELSHGNKSEVARYVAEGLSMDEMVDNLSWRTLMTLHDRLQRVFLREEKWANNKLKVTLGTKGKPSDEDQQQIAKLEQALAHKPRPIGEPAITALIF